MAEVSIAPTRAELRHGEVLLAGTGSESTRATIARTASAAERGADAVLVVAPHYYGAAVSSDALREHYERVADASPIPVLLYTIPKYMHFAIAPEVVAALAQHQNIIGMKDSSGDATLFARYIELQDDNFRVLTGSGVFFADALRMGANGGILAASLFAPEITLAVWHAHERGDSAARALAQQALTPLAATIVGAMGVAGVKGALDRVGLNGGPTRPPLPPLDEATMQQLEHLVRSAELAGAA